MLRQVLVCGLLVIVPVSVSARPHRLRAAEALLSEVEELVNDELPHSKVSGREHTFAGNEERMPAGDKEDNPLYAGSTLSETVRSSVSDTKYQHDVFISYRSDESDEVFLALLGVFNALECDVFNQLRDLAGEKVSKKTMVAHAQGSKVVLALLSPKYFESKWCRAELEGAKAAGIPIVPVFAGNENVRKEIIGLLKKFTDDKEKKAAVKAAFDENLIDVYNSDHIKEVVEDIKTKIVERFVSGPR